MQGQDSKLGLLSPNPGLFPLGSSILLTGSHGNNYLKIQTCIHIVIRKECTFALIHPCADCFTKGNSNVGSEFQVGKMVMIMIMAIIH